MRRIFVILTTIVLLNLAALPVEAQSLWRESNRSISVPSLVDPVQTDGVEIFGVDGTIVVRTTHKVQVRVFTILGQLVTQATLNPGTSEFKAVARGIYIVKIGNITQKVAL